MKVIAIASDHAGFELKEELKKTIESLGFKPLDSNYPLVRPLRPPYSGVSLPPSLNGTGHL